MARPSVPRSVRQMSTITAAYFEAARRSAASRRFDAASTSKPAASKKERSVWRMASSSSTTRRRSDMPSDQGQGQCQLSIQANQRFNRMTPGSKAGQSGRESDRTLGPHRGHDLVQEDAQARVVPLVLAVQHDHEAEPRSHEQVLAAVPPA